MQLALRMIMALYLCAQSYAFTLLGPPAEWMTADKNLGYVIDSGGPMQLNAGYRWNIPEITYGYDLSFLEFFGERGVAALDDAFQILNTYANGDIRAFQSNSIRLQLSGQAANVIDLKSHALSAVLEQLGLGNALRYTFVIRDINITPQNTNVSIVQRNFDPFTYTPTNALNVTRLNYNVTAFPDGSFDAVEVQINQTEHINPGVAGSDYPPGQYAVALTIDDAGGLRYLYATNNFKMETLPPGTTAVDGALVDAAIRPGRGKLRFRRLYRSIQNLTNFFEVQTFDDIYLQNGITKTQRVQRAFTRPDIVFTAADIGPGPNGEPYLLANAINWNNNSALLGQQDEGPGTIHPSGTITFQKLGYSQGFYPQWGAYNRLGGYFALDPLNDNSLPKLQILSGTLSVKLTGLRRKYTLDATDDFTTWTTLTTISNETTSTFQLPLSTTGQRFFRVTEGAPY